LGESLKKLITGTENELNELKNKKKNRNSKNKEKINALMRKLDGWKKIRERAEELTISMDYLDGGTIRELRIRARRFLNDSDTDDKRVAVIEEIDELIDISEQNRRQTQPQLPNLGQNSDNSSSKVDIDLKTHSDMVASNISSIEQIKLKNILDAQDEYGKWHLAIVIDEKEAGDKELHFLPYQKDNRNEVFTSVDTARLSPAYS
jgi:hypothetical protein